MTPPDPWSDLEVLQAHLWARLVRGASESSDSFRTVALATTGAEGPEARMVSLRDADPDARTVEVHTDKRTAKLRALQADPRAALLFWDQTTQEQLRLTLRITMVPADGSRWAAIPPAARLNYGTVPPPGSRIASPGDLTRQPDPALHVALAGAVLAMDALSLAHDPHRRARFDPTGACWIVP